MRVFEAESPHLLYRDQLTALLAEGAEVTVRGRPTREILDVATVIRNPRQRVHVVPGRWANPFLALSDSLHVLAGRGDVASLLPYNQRIVEFSDDGDWLYGAYGPRIARQIMPLIERLRADPSDRRAILSIWEERDLQAPTKDPPCNDLVAFKLRSGHLHMTVFNRSNDLHWGLYAVNFYQFSILQEYIAARLRVDLGTQTHISNSLHVYTDELGARITKRMMEAQWPAQGPSIPLPDLPDALMLFPNGLPNHADFVAGCNAVLDCEEYGGELDEEGVAFLEFASDFLRLYREYKAGVNVDLRDLRHAAYFEEWTIAAKEFLSHLAKPVRA